MQFVKGDPAPLSTVSPRFAEFYGAEHNADFENGNILMSTLLGADINFALTAYGRDCELDPRLVARACRSGVAVEYVGAL